MMADDRRRKGLGRGLSALLGESIDTLELDGQAGPQITVPIERLHPGRYQPRQGVDEGALEELAESISEKGILQPILVRPHPEQPEDYEIVAGERRWRAAQRLGLHQVPAVVRDLADRDAAEVALVENLQRQDLSPLEEAEGFQRLMNEFSRTQDELAHGVGKSRSHVANTLRLLSLPEAVQDLVRTGTLTAGHARALIGADDPAALARAVIDRALNVRQTERLVQSAGKPPRRSKSGGKDADTLALERDLANRLGLAVEIQTRRNGGSLVLHYKTLDQLDSILSRLSASPAMNDGFDI